MHNEAYTQLNVCKIEKYENYNSTQNNQYFKK